MTLLTPSPGCICCLHPDTLVPPNCLPAAPPPSTPSPWHAAASCSPRPPSSSTQPLNLAAGQPWSNSASQTQPTQPWLRPPVRPLTCADVGARVHDVEHVALVLQVHVGQSHTQARSRSYVDLPPWSIQHALAAALRVRIVTQGGWAGGWVGRGRNISTVPRAVGYCWFGTGRFTSQAWCGAAAALRVTNQSRRVDRGDCTSMGIVGSSIGQGVDEKWKHRHGWRGVWRHKTECTSE